MNHYALHLKLIKYCKSTTKNRHLACNNYLLEIKPIQGI